MPGERHLLHLFATFTAGGPQVRTCTIVRGLPETFRHTIVGLDGDFGCAALLAGHPRVAFAPPPRKSRLGAYALRLARLIRGGNPDLVLTYNWGAIEALPGARLAGCRRIVHGEDGFRPDEVAGQKRRRVWFRRLVLPLATKVVVPSRTLLAKLEHDWRVPASKRECIANGIDLDRFAPAVGGARGERDALRARWGVRDGELVVGTVARLRGEKGLDLLLAAFAALPGRGAAARLVIVGDGPEEAALRALAERLSVAPRVVFAGPMSDTAGAYRAFDLFALSSITEQMPIALVEAMGCGLAAVATNVGDVAAMLGEPNRAFVVEGRSAEGFAARLADLLRDPQARARLGAANRAKALAEYGEREMVERYRRLYEEVLAS